MAAGQRPSLVGRLDKLTSGLVLVAKIGRHPHRRCRRPWPSSATTKDYLAVVYGKVNVARGDIDLRLAAIPAIGAGSWPPRTSARQA